MQVAEAYNPKMIKIKCGASLKEVAELLVETRASDIMVVDEDGMLMGVASEGDLIRAVIPKTEEIISSDVPLLAGLEMIEEKGREVSRLKVEDIMIESPIAITEEDPLIKAAQIMLSKMIRRLPVVKEGRLIGSISRADICNAVLSEKGR